MNIRALQQTNYRTNYLGYEATGDAKTDAFYNELSSTTEKSTTKREGNIGKEYIDYQKILQEKISEISVKIRNGDTEQSYQIGDNLLQKKNGRNCLKNLTP